MIAAMRAPAGTQVFKDAGLPVEQVSWLMVQKDFIEPSRGFFRLPSEAEWEFACRAGTDTAFSFGGAVTREQVRFGSDKPVPCGSLPANAWGFREMHGNVSEWVEDVFAPYPRERGTEEPVRQGPSSSRVFRGGSWYTDAGDARSCDRYDFTPAVTSGDIGFRVAASVF